MHDRGGRRNIFHYDGTVVRFITGRRLIAWLSLQVLFYCAFPRGIENTRWKKGSESFLFN